MGAKRRRALTVKATFGSPEEGSTGLKVAHPSLGNRKVSLHSILSGIYTPGALRIFCIVPESREGVATAGSGSKVNFLDRDNTLLLRNLIIRIKPRDLYQPKRLLVSTALQWISSNCVGYGLPMLSTRCVVLNVRA